MKERKIEQADEVDLALERLVDKLVRWATQQPEWVLIFNQKRPQRRKAAVLLARALVTIPVRGAESVGLPRELRRKLVRALKGAE